MNAPVHNKSSARLLKKELLSSICYDNIERMEKVKNEKKTKFILDERAYYEAINRYEFITGYNVRAYNIFFDDNTIIKNISSKTDKRETKDADSRHFWESRCNPIAVTWSVAYNIKRYSDSDSSFDEIFKDLSQIKVINNIDDINQIKSAEEDLKRCITKMFSTFLNSFQNQIDKNFQNIVNSISFFFYLSRNLSLINDNFVKFEFKNNFERHKTLFIELIAFSNIFFNKTQTNHKTFSQFEKEIFSKNLLDIFGKLNQVYISFDQNIERLVITSNNPKLNFYLPVNYLNAKINMQNLSIDLQHRRRSSFIFKDVANGGERFFGLIDYFYDDVLVNTYYCKELICSSDQLLFRKRKTEYIELIKNVIKPLSRSEYMQLSNVYHQMPSYLDYVKLKYENLSSQFLYNCNAHVELFGYYLLKYLDLGPDFTTYRSDFDSKTILILDSTFGCNYRFCENIDSKDIFNASIRDICLSVIKIHQLKVISYIFMITGFNDHNVLLKIVKNTVIDVKALDLNPFQWFYDITKNSIFEFFPQFTEDYEFASHLEYFHYLEPIYQYLESLDIHHKTCEYQVDDIMLTKEWRSTMLTYQTYVSIFQKLIDKVETSRLKNFDEGASLCCFITRIIFDDVCEEISRERIISNEFEHQEEYIELVMFNIGKFLEYFVNQITLDTLDINFSINWAHIIQKESPQDYQYYNYHDEEGFCYSYASWHQFLHYKMNKDSMILICLKRSFSLKDIFIISKKSLNQLAFDACFIWLEDPISFDICLAYTKKYFNKNNNIKVYIN